MRVVSKLFMVHPQLHKVCAYHTMLAGSSSSGEAVKCSSFRVYDPDCTVKLLYKLCSYQSASYMRHSSEDTL